MIHRDKYVNYLLHHNTDVSHDEHAFIDEDLCKFHEINETFLIFQGGYNPNQGGYGGGYPGQQPQVSPETQGIFGQVDKDRSGKINAQELQAALVNGKGQNFSDACCALMISMFDVDRSGTIDVYEFEKLFAYINSWLACFKAYDRDQSGSISEPELSQALSQVRKVKMCVNCKV
jgi:EF-hand domain pair/EF hand